MSDDNPKLFNIGFVNDGHYGGGSTEITLRDLAALFALAGYNANPAVTSECSPRGGSTQGRVVRRGRRRMARGEEQAMSEIDFQISDTRYGFDWGPARVRRILDDKRYGVLIAIVGKRSAVELRVTPGGRVSVNQQRKPYKRELEEAP